MRRQGPRLGTSLRRKTIYDAYMRSQGWFERRRKWAERELARRNGAPITCAVCDQAWTLSDDLHHLDYSNLQREEHSDLVPVHRGCHDDIHEILDSLAFRRYLPARLASLTAIDRVRAAKGI